MTELDSELPSSSAPNGSGLEYNGTSWVPTADDDDNGVFLKHPTHGAISVLSGGGGIKVNHNSIVFYDGSIQYEAAKYKAGVGSGSIVPARETVGAVGGNAVVSGGAANNAHGNSSVVAGGYGNTVDADSGGGIICGGEYNSITGSDAAGILGSNSSLTTSNHCYIIGQGITVSGAADTTFVANLEIVRGSFTITSIPTTNPNSAGEVWSDGGTLKISSGL